MEELNIQELRVLGSLMEKEILTPDIYPLTANALLNACNQKSSRDPVMEMNEFELFAALAGLRKKGLAVENKFQDSRVLKYGHRLEALGAFSSKERSLLTLLFLRGPQTPGELHNRVERLASFESLADVESCLQTLAARPEPALVRLGERHSGEKEPRWLQCLSPDLGPPRPKPELNLAERVAALEAAFIEMKEQSQKLSQKPEP